MTAQQPEESGVEMTTILQLFAFQEYESILEAHRAKKHASAQQIINRHLGLPCADGTALFEAIHTTFKANSRGMLYHDWYHSLCVIVNCYEGMEFTFGKPMNSLSPGEMVELNSILLAAAFHDVGHAGVREPDILNVSRSIVIAAEFMERHGLCANGLQACGVDKRLVLVCIQVTQYPFNHEPQSELQKVLRDADLLQILEPTWFDDIYCHMYEEFLQGSRPLSFADFCRNEHDFLHAAKFYSQWWHERKKDVYSSVALGRVDSVLSYVSQRN